MNLNTTICKSVFAKGQIISKANYGILNSSKKRTNKVVFTTMRLVFVRFLEEIEDTKKTFRNYLTFMAHKIWTSPKCFGTHKRTRQ